MAKLNKKQKEKKSSTKKSLNKITKNKVLSGKSKINDKKAPKNLGTPNQITKDMILGEMVQQFPQTAEVLFEEGIHCLGCGISFYETLEQGLVGHGKSEKEIEEILKKLNKAVSKK